jgi:hypothetical protein
MKQMEKSKGSETVEHLVEVLKVPSADIHAALKSLAAQGHLTPGELFGRNSPVGK